MTEQPVAKSQNRYSALIEWVFDRNWQPGATVVTWSRDELVEGAEALGIVLPKNLGDVIYSLRYRMPMPGSIQRRAPRDNQWIIRGAGRAKYEFAAVSASRIRPSESLVVVKIPDATPEIIHASTLGDEQALLALVRYNRLIDIFLGLTTYSLQNHLRTTAPGIGQAEVDEVYVAVDRHGAQYVLPVQAKGGSDQIGVVQAEQDLAVCRAKFPQFIARPIAAQFMAEGVIALFELTVQDDEIRVVREAHYRLVPHTDVTDRDRVAYRLAAGE